MLDGIPFHRIQMKDIPSSCATVDVELDDNGEVFDTKMIAGLVGFSVHDTNKQAKSLLKPLPGWWMYISNVKK